MNIGRLIFAVAFSLTLIGTSFLPYYYVSAELQSSSSFSLSSSAATSISNQTEVFQNIAAFESKKSMAPNTADIFSPNGNPSLPSPPKVVFPTYAELVKYFKDKAVTTPAFISNGSLGNTIDIQAAPTDRITYLVFQTKLNGTDHVFLTIIKEPTTSHRISFSKPVELTPIHHGIISHLQIAAEKNNVFVAWQDYNSTTGLNSIFVSSSLESGKIFRTYRASGINTDAIEPLVKPNGLMAWKEECPTPPPCTTNCPPQLDRHNLYSSLNSASSAITTETTIGSNQTGSNATSGNKFYCPIFWFAW